ncbi:hypothetical protein ACQPXM_06135 [Kribbella sp. CA-253562]|uniref:hypothetical protein n=1 Tax=Kribbella sp. CA-253562 TaxID=3239942 RepID=UPI003D89D6E7
MHRVVAAVVLLIPASAVTIARLFMTDDSDTRKALDQIAADPSSQRVVVWLGFLAALTVVPAFLALARLARRRRPVLTTIALGVNLAAYLGGYAMFALDGLYLAGAGVPAQQRDGAAALIDATWSAGAAGLSTALFVIGHVLGAILMGLALRGSIPMIGWLAMILSQPGHVVAFVVFQNVVMDSLAWGLMAVCFAIAAITVLRTSDDEWDLPPRRVSTAFHAGTS